MNRIKELRAQHSVKQVDLAKAIRVSPAALSGYETGKYEAELETYQRIAQYFNVSLDYLLGNDIKKETIQMDDLSAEEIEIIKVMHQLSPDGRHNLGKYGKFLLTGEAQE